MNRVKNFAKTLLYILLGTFIAYLAFKFIAPIIAPFIAAMFLTLLIDPIVEYLQKKTPMPRAAAVGTAMLAVFGGAGLVTAFIVARLIIELAHLSTFLPNYVDDVKAVALSLQERAQAYFFSLPDEVIEIINEKAAGTELSLDSIINKAQVITVKILNFIVQLVSSVPAWIIIIIIAGIATYFMAKDKKVILIFWQRIIPEPWGEKSIEIARDIFAAIISYVRAQLILITMTFIQTLIGLYLIGAPYALIMGLVIGIADTIPILGPSSIYLPWIAWEFITGDTGFAIKLLILYGIVIVVRQVMETKIVASSMGLHPLATLTAMYVGLKLLGPVGVIAGPLYIIALKAFVSAGLISWNDKKP
ncbi:MAG: sporulation integral membrane protein YtvI [Firmicutes bacterium HGW-Firmicutes-14]|nr:MAG: sporulation integral membrane protein YtvI [Firmicutes bacterium HGW-Firmicutes-14]